MVPPLRAQTTSDIQDDWEEIQPMLEECHLESELGSVHSIDDEMDLSMDEATSPPIAGSKQPISRSSSIKHSLEEVRTLRTALPKRDDDASSMRSVNTITEDLLDIDIDAPLLLNAISSVTSTLVETISSTSDLNNRLNDHNLEWILSQCRALFRSLSELEQVVKCYASAWDENSRSQTPLDPALYKWTSDLMITLLGLQGAVQEEDEAVRRVVRHSTYALSMDVLQYLAPLIEFKEKIENFLPIMQVDMNEFETANLKFPGADPEPLPTNPFTKPAFKGGRIFQDPLPTLSEPVPTLRRELYILKDNINASIQAISEWHLSFASSPLTSSLQAEQRSVLTALSTVLTNNGTDWLEQNLAGGLRYGQFCSLDIDKIHWFTYEFRVFAENVRMERIGGSYPSKRAGSRNKDNQLNEVGVERLRCAVKELATMLKVNLHADVPGPSAVARMTRDW